MKRRLLFILCLAVLFLLFGCARNINEQKTTDDSDETLVIKGHNFSGKHIGNNTSRDPNYKYSIYFGKDGHFVQDIISSNGFAGRFTEEGTYKINSDGNIIINIVNVTEERFSNDAALKGGQAPISIVQRQGETLNAAEDHPIKIIKKEHYLLGTVNKVKLYPTAKKTVNYEEHFQKETRKYNSSYGILSGHGFTSNGMDTPMNSIVFENNKFIWKYGYQSEESTTNSGVMAIFEGTYSYDSNNHILTLNISNQSNSYYGNLMNLNEFEYVKIGKKLAGNILKLRYSNNTLTLINSDFDSWSMEDSSPEDISQSYPKYDDYVQKYSVSLFTSKMKKSSSVKNQNSISSADDFKDWAIHEGLISGDEKNLKSAAGDWAIFGEDDEGYTVANDMDADGNDVDSSNVSHIHARYTIGFEGGAVDQVVLLGEDSKIYIGNPMGVVRIDTTATSDYQNTL